MKIKGFKDTINWYDNNSEEYANALYTIVPIESINLFLSYLPSSPNILEAGCGPGRESSVFIEKGAIVTGVDVSEGLLKIAKAKNPNAKYIKTNFLNLPFADSVFDGVWSHASLVHLEKISDVKLALSEFKRVLKSNGILYVYVKMQTGGKKTEIIKDSLSNHERFFRFYEPEELRKLLTSSGFEIITFGLKDDEYGRSEVKWIETVVKKV
jgi:ubiquinone/menaquinone biosynthesis C-methylase UbiE